VCDRARVRLSFEARVVPLDLADETCDPGIVVPVPAHIDGVVEEDVAARCDELAPALVVGARALVGVVAVDEDERARPRRRLAVRESPTTR
jgi:hypothetical protein